MNKTDNTAVATKTVKTAEERKAARNEYARAYYASHKEALKDAVKRCRAKKAAAKHAIAPKTVKKAAAKHAIAPKTVKKNAVKKPDVKKSNTLSVAGSELVTLVKTLAKLVKRAAELKSKLQPVLDEIKRIKNEIKEKKAAAKNAAKSSDTTEVK